MQRCVSAVIMNDDGEVLIQNHNKLERYTLPGGKVDANEYENFALIREMFEELGIMVHKYHELYTSRFDGVEYPAHSGNVSTFLHVLYSIEKYEGIITNKEPEKHSELLWVKPENIREIGPISVVLDRYLKFLKL